MAIIKGSVPKAVEEEFRKRAMERYGYTKGALSKALEEAIKLWLRAETECSGEEERNNEAYVRLRDEINDKYSGKYVCIADGKILTVRDTLKEVYEEVRGAGGTASHRLIFRAGERAPEVVRLGWRASREHAGHM